MVFRQFSLGKGIEDRDFGSRVGYNFLGNLVKDFRLD